MMKAIIAGHICIDIFPKFNHEIKVIPGHLYEIGKTTFAIGGAVANTGMTMQRMGMDVDLMSTIGNDDYGRKIISIIKELAPGQMKLPKINPVLDTSYTIVINIPNQDRVFFHCSGANAQFGTKDINWDSVGESDLFHFGYPCFMASCYENEGDELLAIYKQAKATGITTSLDPGMPDIHGPAGKTNWKNVLKTVLPYVDIFMPSADELLYMVASERFGQGDTLQADELTSLGNMLLKMGTAVVAIKLGERGMYFRTADEGRIAAMGKARPVDIASWANKEFWFPIFKPTSYQGGTGAGDASIGGFLTALLRGQTLIEAGTMATAVGACNVEAPDSLSGIMNWEETVARINAGWERLPFNIITPGWKQLENHIWCR